MLRGSKVYSVLTNTCPKCQQGKFFIGDNPFNLKKFDKMHESCSCCGESFKREPGFYIGAMYISYALSVITMIAFFILMILLMTLDINLLIGILVAVFIIFLPLYFRLARLIWINIFVKYDPQAANRMAMPK